MLWKYNIIDCNLIEALLKVLLVGRVFANGQGDLGSTPGRHTKDSKMILDATCLNTRHYKVRIKGKVEQSRERSSTRPYTSV